MKTKQYSWLSLKSPVHAVVTVWLHLCNTLLECPGKRAISQLGGGHGIGTDLTGRWQAHGGGQCPQNPQKQAHLNFLTWVGKSFATQTWGLGPRALLPLHHSQSCVLFPGKTEIFPGSQVGAVQHTQLPQPPQGYHQGGFLYNRSHWISNSRNPVRANSFNWYVCGTVMMAVRQK